MTLAICERLRRTEMGRTNYGGVLAGAFHAMPVNPDGTKAADTIEALVEALERVRNGLRAYLPCSAVMSPVSHEKLIQIIDAAIPPAGRMGEWQPIIGQKVVVTSKDEWASDWVDAAGNPLVLFVAGVRALAGGGVDVTVADEWPIRARPFYQGGGLTDGFIVGRDGEHDDLAPYTPALKASGEE